MFNIAQYLEKFKTLGLGERQIKEAIKNSMKEVLNIDVDSKNIIVKNGEVVFKVSPAIKNAIFIKKEIILKNILGRGAKNIGDLR